MQVHLHSMLPDRTPRRILTPTAPNYGISEARLLSMVPQKVSDQQYLVSRGKQSSAAERLPASHHTDLKQWERRARHPVHTL
jgi:hypothetical protein